MSHLVLNIGSIVPHGQLVHTIKFVAELFEPLNLRTELQTSQSELTLVVELDTVVTEIPNRVHTLYLALHQDAIAYKQGFGDSSIGFLIGPNAADWGGSFNPEFFLNPSWSK